jgi:hypothetical protein
MHHLAAILLVVTLADTDSTQRPHPNAPARPACVPTERMPIGGLGARTHGDSASVMHVPSHPQRKAMPTLVVVPCYLADTLAKLDSASRTAPPKRPK